jgi:uncharacterized cupredoxin-like copper-binding protein
VPIPTNDITKYPSLIHSNIFLLYPEVFAMKHILSFLFLVLASLILAACSSSPPPAEFTIELTEFAFTPNTLEVQVGQEVTIHLANMGALEHEFMVGRAAMMNGQPNGFEHNMFEGEEPMVMGASDEHDMDAMGDMDHGFMVAVPTGSEETTMTFTVTEDMVGEWEIGCFTDGGSHYTQGMTGKLVVKP